MTVLAGKTKLISKSYNETGQFTAFEFSNMGNIICGLGSQEIQSINKTNFRSALVTFSNLNFGCTEQDFSDFMTLAKSTFGNEIWTKYQLEELGLILSGLSVGDVDYLIQTNLSSSLLNSIDPQSFEQMKSSTLLSLTTRVIKQLSRNQLYGIQSNPAYDSFSSDLKNSIEYEINGEFMKAIIEIQTTGATASATKPTLLPENGNSLISSGTEIKFSFVVLAACLISFFFN